MMSIGILVIGHNRPASLAAALSSLSQALIPVSVDLVVSLDDSYNQLSTYAVANEFDWIFGEYDIVRRESKFGLYRNVIESCTLMSRNYDIFVVLEDDIVVSKHFLNYLLDYDSKVGDNPLFAGSSLYSYKVRELDNMPFSPVFYGFQNYIMQFPSSWGQFFYSSKWVEFASWLNSDSNSEVKLPAYIENWPKSSWKKQFVRFMLDRQLYFSFPFWSYSTNVGTRGVNHNSTLDLFDVPLALGISQDPFVRNLDKAPYYDASFGLVSPSLKNSSEIGDATSFFCKFPYRSTFYAHVLVLSISNDFKIALIKFLKLFQFFQR